MITASLRRQGSSTAIAESGFWELLKKNSFISIHRLGQDCPAIPIFSVSLKGLSGSEVVTLLCNRYNIMARYGAHCAEPLMRYWKLPGTVRFSLQFYNTADEANLIAEALESATSFFL
jgi:cysteine desulfurase/selenocysteine lyase